MSEPAKEEDHDISVDRISKLPDCLIHQILSLVPTVDAVCTCVLSKRWRRMWLSVPALQFPCRVGFKNQETREASFNVFVERCLKYRLQSMRYIDALAVTTFELEVTVYPKLYDVLSKWFGSHVIMNNVKDLDLSLFPEEEYTLPSAVLNGRSLTHLKLKGNIRISASCSVNLPSLKSLGLTDIRLDNSVLNNLLIWSPSLENCALRLNLMQHEFHIRLPNLNLKFLQISSPIRSANIEANNIQTLHLSNTFSTGIEYPKFDFSACRAIRDLSLYQIHNSEVGKFENQISKLPYLHSLSVDLPGGKVNISSQSLEYLYIFKFKGEEGELKNEVAIDARNLVSLDFIGNMDIVISMGLLNHHAEGSFYVRGPTSELIKFFSNMNRNWSSLSIFINFDDREETKGGFELPENLKEISLPPWHHLKHLKVKLSRECAQRSDFEDFLKRLAPSLETVSIVYGV